MTLSLLLRRFLILLFSSFVALLFLELGLRAVFGSPPKDGTAFNLFRKSNWHNSGYLSSTNPFCWSGTHGAIRFHPEFMNVWSREKGCFDHTPTNKQGFRSRYDFPEEVDSKFFSILILGGSVAERWSASDKDGAPSLLERWLEKQGYRGPEGKKIRIYTGAMVGARIPTQLNVLLRYGERFDAVIAIDGANELFGLKDAAMLDAPLKHSLATNLNMFAPFGWLKGRVYFGIDLIAMKFQFLKKSVAWAATREAILRGLESDLVDYMQNEMGEGYDRFYNWEGNDRESFAQRNIMRFAQYSRNLHFLSQSLGIKSAHFLQPIAAIAKPLSAEELEKEYRIPNFELYSQLEEMTLKKTAGLPTYSMLKIFEGVKSTVYVDSVHFQTEFLPNDFRSLGYETLFQEIFKKIERSWGLVRDTKKS